ncbi:hypothetical protein DMC30DRAFT_412903 [Rhodotorula diobovata]|uniref:Uncharacterized protein n=1 Tax=Rhodotorula diobovata TaxID=5288 RepID=A0A5C5G6B0_9BASI|nr:hypothetical protein DMC30DRAFT_412903 [Rhodotorula diobovata]
MAVPALRSKPPRCPRTRTIVDSTTAFSRRRARSGKDAKPNLEREVAFGSASGRHVALVLQDKYANRVAGLVAVGGASAREEQALRAKLRRGLGAAAVKTEEVVESVSPEPTIEDAKPQRRCVAFTAAAAPRRTRLQMPEWLAVRTIAFVYRHSRFYLNQLRAAVSLETRRIHVGSFEAAPRLVKRDDSEDEDVKPFALPSAVSTSASEDIKPRLVEMSPSPPAVPTRPHPTAPHQHHSSSINAEDLDTKPFTSRAPTPLSSPDAFAAAPPRPNRAHPFTT